MTMIIVVMERGEKKGGNYRSKISHIADPWKAHPARWRDSPCQACCCCYCCTCCYWWCWIALSQHQKISLAHQFRWHQERTHRVSGPATRPWIRSQRSQLHQSSIYFAAIFFFVCLDYFAFSSETTNNVAIKPFPCCHCCQDRWRPCGSLRRTPNSDKELHECHHPIPRSPGFLGWVCGNGGKNLSISIHLPRSVQENPLPRQSQDIFQPRKKVNWRGPESDEKSILQARPGTLSNFVHPLLSFSFWLHLFSIIQVIALSSINRKVILASISAENPYYSVLELSWRNATYNLGLFWCLIWSLCCLTFFFYCLLLDVRLLLLLFLVSFHWFWVYFISWISLDFHSLGVSMITCLFWWFFLSKIHSVANKMAKNKSLLQGKKQERDDLLVTGNQTLEAKERGYDSKTGTKRGILQACNWCTYTISMIFAWFISLSLLFSSLSSPSFSSFFLSLPSSFLKKQHFFLIFPFSMITSKRSENGSGKQAKLAVQSDNLQKGDSFLSSFEGKKKKRKRLNSTMQKRKRERERKGKGKKRCLTMIPTAIMT